MKRLALATLRALTLGAASAEEPAPDYDVVSRNGRVRPTPVQLEKMQALVATAMRGGAIGVATARISPAGTR